MNVSEYLAHVRVAGQTVNPLLNLLEARVECASQGEAVIVLPLNKKLTQGAGLLAGGVLATIVDEAMAHAALTVLDDGAGIVTMEMSVRYLRPAPQDYAQSVKAVGKVIKKGRQTLVLESSVYDEAGNLLVLGSAGFMILQS